MTVKVGHVKIPFDPKNVFNGAFKYLQTLSGTENICQNIIKISVSSTIQGTVDIPVVRKYEDITYYWMSQSEKIGWYEVDFKNNRFYLESYVIRDHGRDFHTEWKILGSNDGITYDVVDEVTNYQRPPEAYVNYNFTCKYPKARRYFKFYKDGSRFYNNEILVIH